MPYVPPSLTQYSAPTASLFDATPTEYPRGLFEIPDIKAPGANPAVSIGANALLKTGKDLLNGGFSFGGMGTNLASAGAGWAGSTLGTWGEGNAGSKIGGGLGGLLGSSLGPAGSFLGSAIGSALGGNFGPQPTVGPNMQGWLGRNAAGQLDVLGASGDNGLDASVARAALADPVNAVNAYLLRNKLTLGDLPKHFQVRAGENRMEPTIEIGNSVDDAYSAPMLNSNSLLKALIGRGYIKGDLAELGGPDPQRIFNGVNWLEPESIAPVWSGGVFDARGGHKAFDPGRVGNAVLAQQYPENTLFGWTDNGYGALPQPSLFAV